jgi:hypothetical protein
MSINPACVACEVFWVISCDPWTDPHRTKHSYIYQSDIYLFDIHTRICPEIPSAKHILLFPIFPYVRNILRLPSFIPKPSPITSLSTRTECTSNVSPGLTFDVFSPISPFDIDFDITSAISTPICYSDVDPRYRPPICYSDIDPRYQPPT